MKQLSTPGPKEYSPEKEEAGIKVASSKSNTQ
jgi:hypothetical protein